VEKLKQEIISAIDRASGDLKKLALDIHDNPELGWHEFKAVGFIKAFLEKYGFQVRTGYKDIPTSFRADFSGQPGGPRVAFLAEYDALNGVGHGCGHNLIAACSTGAFLGLASVMPQLKGSVCLIGTPAEEGGSGKVKLLDRGAFDDVDFAMMMHPSGGGASANLVGRGGRAAVGMTVEFHGKGAHSSVPKNGINALSAVIQLFNQIDIMRPTFDMQDNINGIITNGGTAANIIPDYARAAFCIRADTMNRIRELMSLVKKCVENSEKLTGAKAEISSDDISAERYPNKPMNQAFKDNMAQLGIEMHWPDPKKQYGSSDIGNVSIKLPIIHDYLSITDDKTIQAHTKEYAAAARTPEALEICLKGAKGLAMTGYDILSRSDFQREILEYHRAQVPDFYKK
jgi:amidohydrolase